MKKLLFYFAEFLLLPITFISAILMRFLTIGTFGSIYKNTIAEKIFLKFGVLPIRDHYYQPLINPRKHIQKPLDADRNLPGIDFNDTMQLQILKEFNYQDELNEIPLENTMAGNLSPYYNNGSFLSGDAEYLYCMIRHFKPKKIIEIGSGFSTLFSLYAIDKNKQGSDYNCELTCIEPYEKPWLEKSLAKIIRDKVENIDISFFKSLGINDILFIDSSHIIRPQGDILYEFLEVIPSLNPGVFIHIHDIFSPKDYLKEWIFCKHLLWNEQYLLEAFLTHNNMFEITGSLNYLYNNFKEEIENKLPILKKQKDREPGSFWFRKKLQ